MSEEVKCADCHSKRDRRQVQLSIKGGDRSKGDRRSGQKRGESEIWAHKPQIALCRD